LGPFPLNSAAVALMGHVDLLPDSLLRLDYARN
jgi:hypothetical protein